MVFTAPDYFPFLVRKFHQSTRWDECNSYATFCKTSQAILDFSIPYGLSVSIGRGVSNGLNSQLVFSMIPKRASSIGYLASSRPLLVQALSAGAEADGAGGKRVDAALVADKASTKRLLDPAGSQAGLLAATSQSGERRDFALASNAGSQAEDTLTGHSPPHTAPLGRGDTLVRAVANGTVGDFAFVRSQQVQDERVSSDLLYGIRSGVWRSSWNTGSAGDCKAAQAPDSTGDYLLLAQMYPSLSSMTGSYILRRSESSELSISGISTAGAQPDLQLVVQHAINRRRWSGEAMLGTSGRVFGLRGQYNFGDVRELDKAAHAYYCGSNEEAKQAVCGKTHGRFSVGSEVYYGAQDASGGVSVGARYRHELPLFSELTCVVNPIMGHVSLAWTQQMRPSVCAAARYDFNVFSLSSELAVGAEWQLDRNSMVKARWSDSQGLRVLADTRIGSMVFSMGLAINSEGFGSPGLGGSANSPSSSVGVKRLVRSFGLQLQWFL
ncbi:Mitochondrial distribution and morphology protein 10 [Coemansia sp. RSA 2320]|nr:Mitochondrial distribution and morphology protein 10 [Coemansia sp. RSA 2320]